MIHSTIKWLHTFNYLVSQNNNHLSCARSRGKMTNPKNVFWHSFFWHNTNHIWFKWFAKIHCININTTQHKLHLVLVICKNTEEDATTKQKTIRSQNTISEENCRDLTKTNRQRKHEGFDRSLPKVKLCFMIAFITWNSNLVPLLEGQCRSNPCRFEFSGFWGFCRMSKSSKRAML